jgi:hypothetical protein
LRGWAKDTGRILESVATATTLWHHKGLSGLSQHRFRLYCLSQQFPRFRFLRFPFPYLLLHQF